MRFFYLIARSINYSSALAIITSGAGWIITLFSVSLASLFIVFPERELFRVLLRWLPLSMLIITFVHLLIYGFFSPAGIKTPLKSLQKVNNAFRRGFDSASSGLMEASGILTELPFYNLITALFASVLTGSALVAGLIIEYKLRGTISLIQLKILYKLCFLAVMINTLIYGFLSLMIAEALTMGERAFVFNILRKQDLLRQPRGLTGIFWRFSFLFVFLFILLLGFAALLVRYPDVNKNNSILYASYISLVFCAGAYLLYLLNAFFKRLFHELRSAANAIRFNREYRVSFTPMEHELASLMGTVNRALDESSSRYESSRETIAFLEKELHHSSLEIKDQKQLLEEQSLYAEQLQRSLVPDRPAAWHNLHFFLANHGMKNGFVDLYPVDKDTLILTAAHITGQQGSVPLTGALIRGILHTSVSPDDSPSRIIKQLNQGLVSSIRSGEYVRVFVAVIDKAGSFRYSSCSYPGVRITGPGGIKKECESDDLYLGLDLNFQEPGEYQEKLDKGERLVICDALMLYEMAGIPRDKLDDSLDTVLKETRESDPDMYLHELEKSMYEICPGSPARGVEFLFLVAEQGADMTADAIFMAHENVSEERYEEACRILEESLVSSPDNERILYQLGKLSLRLKRYDSAVHHLKRYITRNNNNKYAYYLLGTAYFHLNNYEQALECFKKSHSIDSNYGPVLTGMALTLLKLGEKDRALKVMEGIITPGNFKN